MMWRPVRFCHWPVTVSLEYRRFACHPRWFCFPFWWKLERGVPESTIKPPSLLSFFYLDLDRRVILPSKPNKCSCPFPVFCCVRRQSFNPSGYLRQRPITSLVQCREAANIARLLLVMVRPIQSGLYLTVPCHRTATPRVRNGSRIWKLTLTIWREVLTTQPLGAVNPR